ncbi:tyrosine-type recombinase/integrase [Candidatus Ferrigenium straubiae]|jgi:integrase/recombinase XerD|uniref:tyrosine-type recombinase/integrase n=1 Tax=Candidatus Ferrigenium straubiae TaxID=2919506 RepID=UPI003F4AEFF2
MALGKQAKALTKQQIDLVYSSLSMTQDVHRNRLIFLLSIKAGLRAKEIAALRWSMVLDADGNIVDQIALENSASKGQSGRVIPLNKQLKGHLIESFQSASKRSSTATLHGTQIIQTQRGSGTTAQVIVNMFQGWYAKAGLMGCSSHSGRRTFITNAARRISTVGGSLRDVQCLAGHSSLQTTQRYIDSDSEARRKVVDLV